MKGSGINELGHIFIFLLSFSLLIPIANVAAEDKKQEERIQQLESQLRTLTEEVKKMKSEEAPEKVDRISEVERKLDVLAERR